MDVELLKTQVLIDVPGFSTQAYDLGVVLDALKRLYDNDNVMNEDWRAEIIDYLQCYSQTE